MLKRSEVVDVMPEHWVVAPSSPDLNGWDEVIDYLLPVSKEYFMALPRDEPFIRFNRRHDLRMAGLIENVRPNWWRLSPLGRFIQDQVKAGRNVA